MTADGGRYANRHAEHHPSTPGSGRSMDQLYSRATGTQVGVPAISLSEIDFPPVAPVGAVTYARDLAACVCGGHDTRIRVHGVPGWWGCLSRANAVKQPVPGENMVEPGPEEKSAFRLLQESVEGSRKHPILRVPKDQRGQQPWTLITEAMCGRHRYRTRAPAGTVVKILDRRGSFPSAMGNVPVAANRLVRTGPLSVDSLSSAGIYLIDRFDWPNGPHPLGEIAEQDSPVWWISTPHLRLVRKLADAGRLEHGWRIRDSWTGAAATNLFKQYAADIAAARTRSKQAGPDQYVEVKRKSSIAVRGLWPDKARSPFWRPDWSVSVRAESYVRNWVRADQAAGHGAGCKSACSHDGADLVWLGNTDEAGFAEPATTDPATVPNPYQLGEGYGCVDLKKVLTAEEFNRGKR